MAITATKFGGGDFQSAPPGRFLAICHRVIDCGTQTVEFKGEKKKQRKVRLQWELSGENLVGDGNALMDDGKPFVVTRNFTLSLGENSHLRPFLEAWRGKPFTEQEETGFDIEQLLGAPCLIDIVHEKSSDGSKTYANVKTASRIMKGMTTPIPVNEMFSFSLEDFNESAFGKLHEKTRDYIAQSDEFKALNGNAIDAAQREIASGANPTTKDAPFDDEIPF